MKDTTKAYLAALLQVIIIGFSFLFVKIALKEVTPLTLLAYRFFFAGVASFVPIVTGRVQVKLQWRDVMEVLPLALIYPVLFFGFQSFGLLYATSTEAGILSAMTPILTVILAAIFLKEKTTSWQKFFLLLSMSGVVYLSIMNQQALPSFSIVGTILLLLSSLSGAGYNVLSRKLSRAYSSYTLTLIMTCISFIIFAALSFGEAVLNNQLATLFTPLTSVHFVGAVLYLGVLSSFGSALLTNYALSKLEASKVSVFANLTPLISLLAGGLILNEPLNGCHLVGICVTALGVWGTNYMGRRR